MNDPLNPPLGKPAAGKQAQRKKLMVYGAVGAALLAIVLLRRGNQTSTPATDPNQLAPVANPAIDTSGSIPDSSAQLADFETQLESQIGQAVATGVATGIAAMPAPSVNPGGPTTGDPSIQTTPPVTINIGSGVGQQVGAGAKSPSHPAPAARSRTHPTIASRIAAAVHVAHTGTVKGTVKGAAKVKTLAEQHPDWGPHTLAHGGRIKGHSTRF